jgi:hypothetical protein
VQKNHGIFLATTCPVVALANTDHIKTSGSIEAAGRMIGRSNFKKNTFGARRSRMSQQVFEQTPANALTA